MPDVIEGDVKVSHIAIGNIRYEGNLKAGTCTCGEEIGRSTSIQGLMFLHGKHTALVELRAKPVEERMEIMGMEKVTFGYGLGLGDEVLYREPGTGRRDG